MLRKRSVIVDGRKTSVTVEDAFWDAAKQLARARRVSLAQLVSAVDLERSSDFNLSSALRVEVMTYFRMIANADAGRLPA